MSKQSEQAVDKFQNGMNCSQAVLSSYSESFGLDGETASRVATGFGGGMRMAETCGAVTGAFMVLGLKYGNSTSEDKEVKAKTYEKIVEYISRFKARHGSVMCRELLDCDITTPEGATKAKENNLFNSICPKLVRDAAEVLEEMLEEK